MSVLDVIRDRKSIRSYRSDPIPDEILFKILEAGRLAPSGKNLQPWKFIIVRDNTLKKRLSEACVKQFFMAEVPVIIAACAFPENCYARMGRYMKSWPVDVAIALEHMILVAQEEGLGTCILGWFNEKKVKALLHIPKSRRVELIITLGYPASEQPREKRRKSMDDISSFNRY